MATRDVSGISIDSPGGDMNAARILVELANAREIRVTALDRCASACVWIWASSSRRRAFGYSRLGIHRPHIGLGDDAPFVRALMSGVAERHFQRLREANFPESLLQEAATSEDNAPKWIYASQLRKAGVQMELLDHDLPGDHEGLPDAAGSSAAHSRP